MRSCLLLMTFVNNWKGHAGLGMCLSYDEVTLYKQSLLVSQTPNHAAGLPLMMMYSLDELHEQMSSVACDVYSKTHLKHKLMER